MVVDEEGLVVVGGTEQRQNNPCAPGALFKCMHNIRGEGSYPRILC